MEAIQDITLSEVATRQNIDEVKSEINGVRFSMADLKSEMADTRAEIILLKSDISDFKSELFKFMMIQFIAIVGVMVALATFT